MKALQGPDPDGPFSLQLIELCPQVLLSRLLCGKSLPVADSLPIWAVAQMNFNPIAPTPFSDVASHWLAATGVLSTPSIASRA